MRAALANPAAVAVLDAVIAWWADYVASFIGVARSVLAGRRSDPELALAWDDRMSELLRVCRLVVDRCAADGVLRDDVPPAVAAELLWGLLSIPLWDQLTADLGWSRDEYRDRMQHTARAALLAGDARDRT